MHESVIGFMNGFNLLNKVQLGLSAEHNTSELLDEAYNAINNSRFLFTIFFYFSKLFDTVDYEVFLLKN